MRERIYEIIFEADTPAGKVFDILLLVAILGGVVALMLEDDPSLTPDDVKCRLLGSAMAAIDPAGNPAYTPFQQGAGLINTRGAITSTDTGCGNPGLVGPTDHVRDNQR